MVTTRKIYKSYALRFLVVVCAYLLFAMTMTTTVDPWRVLRMPWALDSLDDYRDFGDSHRTGKAGLAKDPEGWDIAYIGSSRVEMGLTTDYQGFGDKRVVNLGLAGGLIEENTAMARYVIKKNPQLKTILFGIDSGDLTSRVNLSGQTDFLRSPLADGQSIVESTLAYMTGVRALSESIVVISNRFKDRKSNFTKTGQRVGSLGDPPPLRSFIEERIPFYRSQARAFDTPEHSPLNGEKYEKLAGFLHEARDAGIRIIMIMTPRHALMQVNPNENAPMEAPWERERLELAKLCQKINAVEMDAPEIRFLDFCTFSDLNTQPLPPSEDAPFVNWPDLEHGSRALGLKVLERIFSEDPQTFPFWGVDVLETGIDVHLEQLRNGHEKYCVENPEDVAWFRPMIFADLGNQPRPSTD